MDVCWLLEEARRILQHSALSPTAARRYERWIERFCTYHQMQTPALWGEREIEDFLTHIAFDWHVTQLQQEQAYNAILLLFREVMRRDPRPRNTVQAYCVRLCPAPLSAADFTQLLAALPPPLALFADLLRRCDLQPDEALWLRVHDIDIHAHELNIRRGHQIAQTQALPSTLLPFIERHIKWLMQQYQRDLNSLSGHHQRPKMWPDLAAHIWGWQHLFPADRKDHEVNPKTSLRPPMTTAEALREIRCYARSVGITRRIAFESLR